jgi:hypothetical protein
MEGAVLTRVLSLDDLENQQGRQLKYNEVGDETMTKPFID